VLGKDLLLIHCVRCAGDEISAIQRSGAAVATCPRSNAYFGHGRAPVDAMRRAGVRVAVGSDSMASNASMDLLAEAELALEEDPRATAGECWRLATLGGAIALGLDSRVGSLEPGKEADLAAFPLGTIATDASGYPVLGPDARASLVVVAGVERVRDGRVVGDSPGVVARAATTAAHLREWRRRVASA